MEPLFKQLENIFPDIKKEKVTCGERWILNNNTVLYLDDFSEQGSIFKDKRAYEQSLDAVCYMSEYLYDDYRLEVKTYILDYLDGDITIDDLCDGISKLAKYYGYTHRDFLDECNNQEEIASLVFDLVDWQSIKTLVGEMFSSYELEKYEGIFVYTKGMKLKEYLYDEYKREWLAKHKPPTYEEFLNKDFKDTNYIKTLIDKLQGVKFCEDK